MAERIPNKRLRNKRVRVLLHRCLSCPADYSIAPIRVHEAASALDEVLTLRAEVARLRSAALKAVTAAWSSGYAAREYDRDNGEEFDRDYTLGEVEAGEYLDEQMEVSDG